jgi:hypothetical protein
MSDLQREVLALMLSMYNMDGLARERVLRAIKNEYFNLMLTHADLYPNDCLCECIQEEYNRRLNVK